MEVKYRIITNINITHQSCMSIEAKNSILKAELDELTNILQPLTASNGVMAGNYSIDGFFIDI